MPRILSRSVPIFLVLGFLASAPAAQDRDEPPKGAGAKEVRIPGDVDVGGALDEALRQVRILVVKDDDEVSRALPVRSFQIRGGYLGVELVEMTPELREHFGVPREVGVLVGRVEPESPAARGGMRVGDILLEIDGRPIRDSASLVRAVRVKEEAEQVGLEVARQGRRRSLSVTIEQRERPQLDLSELVSHEGVLRLEKLEALPREGASALLTEPRGHFVFRFDPQVTEDAARRLEAFLRDDAFQGRLEEYRRLEEELEEKLQQVEQRLRELERHLDKSPQR